MTVSQKRVILERIQNTQHDIDELKRVRMELGTSQYSSASLSSAGGSKAYTRQNLKDVSDLLMQLQQELAQLYKLLAGGNGVFPTKQIYHIWF